MEDECGDDESDDWVCDGQPQGDEDCADDDPCDGCRGAQAFAWQSQRAHTYTKIGASSRAVASLFAVRNGLLTNDAK